MLEIFVQGLAGKGVGFDVQWESENVVKRLSLHFFPVENHDLNILV
jgi:hypothetical protein